MEIFVPGEPAPQGSKTYVGRGRMRESSKRVKPWRALIVAKVRAVHPRPVVGGVAVDLVFYRRRPKSHFRRGRDHNLLADSAPRLWTTTPDVDKLSRAVLDALTMSGVIADDRQVVELRAFKKYTVNGNSGVSIRLQPVDVSGDDE